MFDTMHKYVDVDLYSIDIKSKWICLQQVQFECKIFIRDFSKTMNQSRLHFAFEIFLFIFWLKEFCQ